MKWLKHYATASESVKLTSLIDKYGVEGYGRYWLLLEILGRHWDGENDEIQIHRKTMTKQLGYYRHTTTEHWLDNVETLNLIVYRKIDNVFFITAPILRELQSKDYKYEKNKRSKNDPKIKTKIKTKSKIKRKSVEADFFNKIDSEILEWLKPVTQRTIDKWVNGYPDSLIIEEINKAYEWNMESGKKVKSVGSFISNWLGRCEKEEKDIGDKVHDFLIEQGVNLDHLA